MLPLITFLAFHWPLNALHNTFQWIPGVCHSANIYQAVSLRSVHSQEVHSKVNTPPFLACQTHCLKDYKAFGPKILNGSVSVSVSVCRPECRCGCKLQAWDNMVLAPGAAASRLTAAPPAADRGGRAKALSCRATRARPCRFVLPLCQVRDGRCVCGSTHTDWFYLLFPVLEGMARLCRPRPSWIKPPINVKVSCGFKQAFIFKFTFSRSF